MQKLLSESGHRLNVEIAMSAVKHWHNQNNIILSESIGTSYQSLATQLVDIREKAPALKHAIENAVKHFHEERRMRMSRS